MTKNDETDRALERHFMHALKVALVDRGLTLQDAERKVGLASGTLSLWMRGHRMPSAMRFAQVVADLGLDPGAVLNDGHRRALESGALDGVEVLPPSE